MSQTLGNKLEILGKKILEIQGFQVHRVAPPRRFFHPVLKRWVGSAKNDIFGCDLFAIHKRDLSKSPLLVQTTTENQVSMKKKKISQIIKRKPKSLLIEVWAWHGGRGNMFFRCYRYRNDGSWQRYVDVDREGNPLH